MRAAAAMLLIIGCASTAHAQQEDSPIELGAAVGYAKSLHGDLDFGAPSISATGRFRVNRLVVVEAQVGYWWHTVVSRFDVPGGNVVETRDRNRFTSLTGSVLIAPSLRSRAAPYGGGGVGVYYYSSRYDSGGPPAVWNSTTIGGQLIGGVDVRATRRIKPFGEFRFEIQSFDDPGSADYRVLGGVRIPVG